MSALKAFFYFHLFRFQNLQCQQLFSFELISDRAAADFLLIYFFFVFNYNSVKWKFFFCSLLPAYHNNEWFSLSKKVFSFHFQSIWELNINKKIKGHLKGTKQIHETHTRKSLIVKQSSSSFVFLLASSKLRKLHNWIYDRKQTIRCHIELKSVLSFHLSPSLPLSTQIHPLPPPTLIPPSPSKNLVLNSDKSLSIMFINKSLLNNMLKHRLEGLIFMWTSMILI